MYLNSVAAFLMDVGPTTRTDPPRSMVNVAATATIIFFCCGMMLRAVEMFRNVAEAKILAAYVWLPRGAAAATTRRRVVGL